MPDPRDGFDFMAQTCSHGRRQPSLHELPPHLQPGPEFDPSLGVPDNLSPLDTARHPAPSDNPAGRPMPLDGNPSRHDPARQGGHAVSSLPAGAYAIRDASGDTLWLLNGLTLDQVCAAGRQAADDVLSSIGKATDPGHLREIDDALHRSFFLPPGQYLAVQAGLAPGRPCREPAAYQGLCR